MATSSLFLIDTLNNNKVVGEFNNQEEVNNFLNNKEFTEFWQQEAETFEEWKEDNFFTVTSEQMNEAVRKFGSRKLNYWT